MKIQSRSQSLVRVLCERFLCLDQLRDIPPAIFVWLIALAGVSLILLFSAGGGFSPWCWKQAVRFGLGGVLMLAVAATPIRLWYSYAYWLYGIALAFLFLTTFTGIIGMGAQRWVKIAFVQFQPSELMRIALILALARCFNDHPAAGAGIVRALWRPLLLLLFPVALTLEQPDLGTAMVLILGGGALLFFVGIPLRFFAFVFWGGCAVFPLLWRCLHTYQKKRILTFLNPETDPLGAGYHILQSKIAIGSGGFWGKGFCRGTQSTLDFLPEKHTDFIFTLLSEEFGFFGAVLVCALYGFLISGNFLLAFRPRNIFCRLVIVGLTVSFALYVLINIAMVVGLLPVVGIPLPLVSYGGTSIVTLMVGQGLILSAAFYRPRPNSIHLFQKTLAEEQAASRG